MLVELQKPPGILRHAPSLCGIVYFYQNHRCMLKWVVPKQRPDTASLITRSGKQPSAGQVLNGRESIKERDSWDEMGIILSTLCSVARRDENDVSSCPLLQRVHTRACVCMNVHVCSCVLGTWINAHMCVSACWCHSLGGGKYCRLSQRVSNPQGSACLCLLALWLQTCHNTQAFQGEFWPPSSDPDIGPRTPLGIHFEEMACSWDHNELFSFLRNGPSVVSLSGSQLYSGSPCLSLGEPKR